MEAFSCPGGGLEPQDLRPSRIEALKAWSKCRTRTGNSTIHGRMLYPFELISRVSIYAALDTHIAMVSVCAPAGTSENPVHGLLIAVINSV